MDDRLLEIARDALARYGLAGADLAMIAHRGNATFRVDRDGARFVLRLHVAGAALDAGPRESAPTIASELRWLDGLARDTDLRVPRPVRTSDGDWVATLAHPGGDSVLASLRTWVEGGEFVEDRPEATAQARALGEAVATLHGYAERWTPPDGFSRPAHDASRTAWIERMVDHASKGGIVGEGDARVLKEVLLRIADVKAADLRSASPYAARRRGMVHGDLHRGNIVTDGTRIGLIDFSLCGFGLYVQDLGTAVSALGPSLARAFLDAYMARRPLAPESLRALEACALETRIARLGVLAADGRRREFVRRLVPPLVTTAIAQFLEAQ